MLEVTVDLDWADEREAFVSKVKDWKLPGGPALELTMSNGVIVKGHVDKLREFAAQIIAGCDQHYPLEVAAAS